jgi:hypothetical protein
VGESDGMKYSGILILLSNCLFCTQIPSALFTPCVGGLSREKIAFSWRRLMRVSMDGRAFDGFLTVLSNLNGKTLLEATALISWERLEVQYPP